MTALSEIQALGRWPSKILIVIHYIDNLLCTLVAFLWALGYQASFKGQLNSE